MSFVRNVTILCAFTTSTAAGQSLTVVNANLSHAEVDCSGEYAYQSYRGGNCSGPGNPQQNFNSALGIGWTLPPLSGDGNGNAHNGDGITGADTAFGPPSFSGLPFSHAFFLQGANTLVAQSISGFVPGGSYTLTFYLGSRYASGSDNGDQTVEFLLDGQLFQSWQLSTDTPFVQQTAPFSVSTGGSHLIEFMGTATGDHTAFLSGFSVQTVGGLAVTPSTSVAGSRFESTGSGFMPLENVDLVAYANTRSRIATAIADANGKVTLVGRLPQTPFGACGLQAIGRTSGAVVSGLISVRAVASASPNSGAQESTVTLIGLGFAPGEVISLSWSNPQTSVGGAIANKNGSVAVSFAIPAGAPAGTATITAIGQKTGAAPTVEVTVE